MSMYVCEVYMQKRASNGFLLNTTRHQGYVKASTLKEALSRWKNASPKNKGFIKHSCKLQYRSKKM